MFTCSKSYSDIPFAHRQPHHSGQCSFIHGHNWSFRFTFGCQELDESGFVVDFSNLRFIRDWLMENLDHAFLHNLDDAVSQKMVDQFREAFRPYPLESCSAEGIAQHVFHTIEPLLKEHHGERVFLVALEVFEDDKNAAEFRKVPSPSGGPCDTDLLSSGESRSG